MTDRPSYGAKLPMAIGLAALVMLIGGAGFWSVRTQIAGAIIAPGTVVVEHNRQVVQHAEGGIVGEIVARDGDNVQGGDLLIALDDTLLTSELAVARA